jgi:hypothetical protein
LAFFSYYLSGLCCTFTLCAEICSTLWTHATYSLIFDPLFQVQIILRLTIINSFIHSPSVSWCRAPFFIMTRRICLSLCKFFTRKFDFNLRNMTVEC